MTSCKHIHHVLAMFFLCQHDCVGIKSSNTPDNFRLVPLNLLNIGKHITKIPTSLPSLPECRAQKIASLVKHLFDEYTGLLPLTPYKTKNAMLYIPKSHAGDGGKRYPHPPMSGCRIHSTLHPLLVHSHSNQKLKSTYISMLSHIF